MTGPTTDHATAQPLRPHHLDQRYLEERFKALEDRVAALERLVPVEAESFDKGGWTRRLDWGEQPLLDKNAHNDGLGE